MSRVNTKTKPIFTHEGAKASHINFEQQLRRSVMSCLLWENEFYEDGISISNRIADIIPKVHPDRVYEIASEARNRMKLRHVPLFIAREMSKYNAHKEKVSLLLEDIIQRPDELTEFLAIYWKDKKQPISNQVKKGLARAFNKFDSYQLAKYNRDTQIKLRDVLFLCHAKPKDKDQEQTWKQLVDNTLPIPDTWEVELSDSKDKKASWERLLKENRLGALALLRNLRNMMIASVEEDLILNALDHMKVDRVLPFRFISAARYAPQWENSIELAMLKCLSIQEKMLGHTVLLIDVSGSMDSKISNKSDITRLDTACGVGMLLREVCEKVDVFTFSEKLVQVPSRRGFALRDAIKNSQPHNGTPLGLAVKSIYASKGITQRISHGYYVTDPSYKGQDLHPDRLIVITDEQSNDTVPDPEKNGYMINVASYKNGVGYGEWTHIDGWSEAVIDYIREYESC